MEWNHLLKVWNQSYIRLVGVDFRRLDRLAPPEPVLLRANRFIVHMRGRAVHRVGDREFHADGCCVIHAGRGQAVHCRLLSDAVEICGIDYQCWPAFPYRQPDGEMPDAAVTFGFPPPNPLAIQEQVAEILKGWSDRERPMVAGLNLKGRLYQLFHEIIEQAESHARGSGQSVADRIIRYIELHHHEPISVAGIAERFHYSERHLAKLIKRRTGYTPLEFLTRCRIEHAKRLLRTTESSVKEIAERVGYADMFYFMRLFKRLTGMPPNRYRLMARAMPDADHPVAEHPGAERPIAAHPYANRPYDGSDSDIDPAASIDYPLDRIENHYQRSTIEGAREEDMLNLGKAKGKLAALGLAALLGACSSGQTDGGGSGTEPAAANPANGAQTSVGAQSSDAAQSSGGMRTEAEAAAFPRTFVDDTGKEIMIEKQPERIAVGHFAEMEYFFALDVPPVASPLAAEILREFRVTIGDYAANADVADLGDVVSPDLEKLLEVEPDLIIGTLGLHEEVYDQLNAIAPVVMFESAGEWDDRLREYAALIGKEDKAESYIAELKQAMRDANRKLEPYRGETTALLRIAGPQQFGAMGTKPYKFYYEVEDGLGLTAPEGYPETWQVVSLEGLAGMDSDHLVIFEYTSEYEAKIAEFEKNGVWNSLKAVKNGNVHFIDIAAATNGPFAIRHAIAELVRSFTS
ncbi:MAG: hypothetical protein C6W55_04760 [Thermobacillus sp.]|uniref:AraC family transcriptional regulator n=1 Tax=Thermobacillus sp. TaxID=2108467 RepID=UPI000E37BD7F|nr:AraC family transcriptional regulator [Thermobacillus sp.]REK57493.1 MAG: hypothetical protein C6W55_04760 [Thermobacillus sp.]